MSQEPASPEGKDDFILTHIPESASPSLRQIGRTALLYGLGISMLLSSVIWIFVIMSLPVKAPAGAFSGWTAYFLTLKTYPLQIIGAICLNIIGGSTMAFASSGSKK